jgi:hypothetical protein
MIICKSLLVKSSIDAKRVHTKALLCIMASHLQFGLQVCILNIITINFFEQTEERGSTMTTDEVKAITERMEKLNPKNRDMLAKKILEEIEAMEWDERWDETLASPESRAFSAKRRKEVIAEHQAGETIPLR